MTDPRYIFEVTGQMSQMGPWGIRLPDGPGQTDATLYFKSREEAEEYMREHPVEEGIRCKCGCTPDSHALVGTTYVYCMANDCDCLMFRPPIPPTREPLHDGGDHFYAENFGMKVGVPAIPPTSAPWREGGHVADKPVDEMDYPELIAALRAALGERDAFFAAVQLSEKCFNAERKAREQAECALRGIVELPESMLAMAKSIARAALSKPSGSK